MKESINFYKTKINNATINEHNIIDNDTVIDL
jgi:hypothetical protein